MGYLVQVGGWVYALWFLIATLGFFFMCIKKDRQENVGSNWTWKEIKGHKID